MVVLHQSKPIYDLPSASPFTIKLELFLRAADIPYKISHSLIKAPKGKQPFIEYQGELIGDSSLIMDRLIKDFNIQWDTELSPAQMALARLTKRTLEEAVYFCAYFLMWGVDENWVPYRDALVADVPKWLRVPLGGLFRRRALSQLRVQGTGRHTREEIDQMGILDYQAIETMMLSPFFFGDKFTTIDCTVYAFFVRAIKGKAKSAMGDYCRNSPAILDYCRHIDDIYNMTVPGAKVVR